LFIDLIKTIELTDYRPDGIVAQRRAMNAFCAPDGWSIFREIDMTSHAIGHIEAAALYRCAAFLHGWARGLWNVLVIASEARARGRMGRGSF
jgi:hypothetical protein